MKQNKRYGRLLILIILFFMISVSSVLASNAKCILKRLNNTLAAKTDNVPLDSLLARLREKTGITFLFAKDLSDTIISVEFQALPMQEAIRRILNRLNHAIIFGSEGKIQKVIIFGESNNLSAPPVYEYKTLSNFNPKITGLPDVRGKKTISDKGIRKISNAGAGMQITHDGGGMQITHGGDGMQITHSPGKMKITHSSGPMTP